MIDARIPESAMMLQGDPSDVVESLDSSGLSTLPSVVTLVMVLLLVQSEPNTSTFAAGSRSRIPAIIIAILAANLVLSFWPLAEHSDRIAPGPNETCIMGPFTDALSACPVRDARSPTSVSTVISPPSANFIVDLDFCQFIVYSLLEFVGRLPVGFAFVVQPRATRLYRLDALVRELANRHEALFHFSIPFGAIVLHCL